ncbi:MAG: decarboxylating 6-phosphogluconate dehydrogenase [Candidatus Pacearchaeota archaeon]
MKKHIGFIGLGKMGSNMVLKLLDEGYRISVYNRSSGKSKSLGKKKNVYPYFSLKEFSESLSKPRIIFIMVTAGKAVDKILEELEPQLSKKDIIIDGGNSNYEDSIKRYKKLKKKGLYFLDVGVSGGVKRARNGTSLMIGGDKNIFKKVETLFRDLSAKKGYEYFGTSGAGHFVKTIHNSIEYSLLESYGEGFEILHRSREYKLDYEKISRVWNNGSIIQSRIIELAEKVFRKEPELKNFIGKIGGGETGSWGLKIAKKEKVEAGALEHAIKKRKSSMKKQSFSTKFVSALRKEFGGHEEPR